MVKTQVRIAYPSMLKATSMLLKPAETNVISVKAVMVMNRPATNHGAQARFVKRL